MAEPIFLLCMGLFSLFRRGAAAHRVAATAEDPKSQTTRLPAFSAIGRCTKYSVIIERIEVATTT